MRRREFLAASGALEGAEDASRPGDQAHPTAALPRLTELQVAAVTASELRTQ